MKTPPLEVEAVILAEFSTECNMYAYKKGKQWVILSYRGYCVHDPINFEREHVLPVYPFCKEVVILNRNCFDHPYEEHMNLILKQKAH